MLGELIELGVASRLLLGLTLCAGLGERELTVEELGPAARADDAGGGGTAGELEA